jgi:hypothetical protein
MRFHTRFPTVLSHSLENAGVITDGTRTNNTYQVVVNTHYSHDKIKIQLTPLNYVFYNLCMGPTLLVESNIPNAYKCTNHTDMVEDY